MTERPRVLITRAFPGVLDGALSRRGLEPVHLALSELFATEHPPPSARPPVDGVLVTSASVAHLAPQAIRWMRDARVVAVGEATARALLLAGATLPVVAAGTGEDALRQFLRGRRPCFVGAARPAPALAEAVATGRVSHWPVYDRRTPRDIHRRYAQLEAVAVVTLASPSAARSWAALGDRKTPCVAIGPTTASAAAAAGLEVLSVAHMPSMDALAQAAWRSLSDRSSG
ncbi:MAG: hypothetical protein CL927_12920 [Deltaproteobacteria bacterium]|nr:hypothetical protein [Deltaproteobacteria bacterium]HCH64873.1 hypothetical protein [Deltaproteobacteria bacterium]